MTTKPHKEVLSRTALKRIAFALLAVLFLSILIHEFNSFERQVREYEASVTSLAEERLASIAEDMHGYILEGLRDIQTLSAVVGEYDTPGMRQGSLDRFVNERGTLYFARYVTADGTSLESGVPLPPAGDADDPFVPLRALSEQQGKNQIVTSELQSYALAASQEGMSLVYLYMPASAGAYLAIAFAVDPLFEQVRQGERAGEWLMLLDAQGRYLVGTDGEMHLQESFFEDYPQDVTERIFGSEEAGIFVHDGQVFTYRHVMTPGVTVGITDRQYWVLLEISEERDLYSETRDLELQRIASLATFALLILMLGWCMALLARRPNPRHHA